MRCPTLAELPAPPSGKSGWPWTEESRPLPDKMPNGQLWPCISIVTPSYNQGQFIEETIRSVLLQGYPNLQYIIIDGGSTDDSVNIIQKYANWLDYWVSEKDNGQSEAINKGVARSHGEIITWVCSDDYYEPGAVAKAVDAFIAHPDAAVVHSGVRFVSAQSTEVSVQRPAPFDFVQQVRTCVNPIAQAASFIRSSIWEEVGGVKQDLHYIMDWDLWLRIGQAYPIHCIDDVWANARFHPAAKNVAGTQFIAKELEKMYERLFVTSKPASTIPFQREALSNAWIGIGKAYYEAYMMRETRRCFIRAFRTYPMSVLSLLVLRIWISSFLGATLMRSLRIIKGKWFGDKRRAAWTGS